MAKHHRRTVIPAIAALVLVPAAGACTTHRDHKTPIHPRTLVTLGEEGGVVGHRLALIVSTDHRATMKPGACVVHFRLGAALWGRLETALKRVDMHALAGDYPAPPGSADEITTVITVGRDRVRIAPNPDPRNQQVSQALKPVMMIVYEIVLVGRHRLPASCSSNR